MLASQGAEEFDAGRTATGSASGDEWNAVRTKSGP